MRILLAALAPAASCVSVQSAHDSAARRGCQSGVERNTAEKRTARRS